MRAWILAPLGLAAIAAVLWRTPNWAPLASVPTNQGPGENDDLSQRRAEWIEAMHQHAPGLDWRALDAATRAALGQQRAVHTVRSRTVSQAPSGVPLGVWRERGANNQAGRVSDVDYDPAADRITVFAHGGQLWQSTLATINWRSLNDARHFEAHYNMQHFVRLSAIGTTPERWIAADDTRHGMYYSDNQGATWQVASGLALANWVETSYLTARNVSGSQVYATIGNYNFTTQASDMHLVVSADRGASFTDLGVQGTEEKIALFAPGQGSNLVYLLTGNVLKRVETNNILSTLATITGTPTQVSSDKVGLAGGITAGATPTPFLFAFFEAGGQAKVFQSLNSGTTWSTRGTIPATANIHMTPGTALHDPTLVFFGGQNLYRSSDGGQTFAYVNDWPAYYTDSVHNLHADISYVKSYIDANNHEVFFIGTDGGVYESTDNVQTVNNISINGLRQAQYYASYTGRNPPYTILASAQDQGYQRNSDPPSGIAGYQQLLSGDFGALSSSDGGATVWNNETSFTQIDPTPTAGGVVLPRWDFSTDGNLQNMLFLPPLMADPTSSYSAWLAGGAATAGLNHVIKLTWNGTVAWTGTITSDEGTYDFGGQVTALANDGGTFFAVANNSGGNASFFRTTTPGGAWSKTVTTLPQGQFFYGNGIVVDPFRANTIYVSGSGYSGPGVYVSTNNGTSFTAMNAGLPSTLIYALAISPDGANLFAATEVGPYYYDRGNSMWVDIGASAPDNIYWNVDFISALNIARFSTYGRGLWDYDLGGGDEIFRAGFE